MRPDSWAALALRLTIAGSAVVTLVLMALVFSAGVHAQEEPPIVYEAPVFDSAELIGNDYVLNWSPPAAGDVPAGGYDVVVDNVDTNLPHAVVYTYNVTGLDTLIEHCFRVQSRHTQALPSSVFPESNEICVPPVPSQTVPYDITNLNVTVIP